MTRQGKDPVGRDAVCQRFGENLSRARRLAGLSQDELSWRVSLHRTEISNLERGRRIPRLDTVLKLAGGLEIAPADLLAHMAWLPEGQPEPGTFELGA